MEEKLEVVTFIPQKRVPARAAVQIAGGLVRADAPWAAMRSDVERVLLGDVE